MIDIYNVSGNLLSSPLLGLDAERVEELMTSDYVQLAWQSDSGETLPAGTYVMLEGERFSLLDPYEPEQKDEAEWSYRPQFQSRVMGWGKVPFFHYVYSAPNTISAREPDWTLTDTPANFMAAVCRAIKHETGETWTYEIAGDLIGLSATISFSATDILSGLSAISGQFDTEWRADKATNTLYLGKAQFGTAITLEVDANVGVPSVTKSKEGYYNRFYIYGSTRNITQDYQGANVNGLVNKRLTLDPAKFPGGYIDMPRAAGVPVYSKTLIFDEIYPHSGLTISNLRARLMYRLDEEQNKIQIGTDAQGNPVYDMYTIWFFQLPGFTLNDSTYSADNPDGMLISGKNLSIHFKSGALTGREFELIYHPKAEQLRNSDGQDFSVLAGDYEIKFQEESGLIIPMQTGIVPADGDEVILYNLRMPQEYIATACGELEATALKEIEERYTTDLNNYTVKSNPVVFATSDPGLSVGRSVQYVNGDYSYTTRVIKLVRKLDVPSEQEITIGNAKIKGNTATLKEEVVNANSNIDLLTQLNQLNQSAAQAYQRTQQMMLDSIAKMENYWAIDPTDPDTIWTPYNVLSRKEITAYGGNGNAGGDGNVPGVGTGATRLRFLEDVLLPEAGIADESVLTFDAQTGMWVAKQVKSGLDTSELAAYLQDHDYAKLSDIPALPDLSIYATEEWVNAKGYALASALDDYVTIATPQEVSGQKRFTQSILLGTADDYIELSYSGGAFRVNSNLVAAGEVTAYGSADYETFGVRRLDDLLDVSLGAIAVGDALVWDGEKWTNQTVSVSGGGGLDTAAGDARYVLKAGDMMTGALNINMPVEPIVRFYRDEVNKGSVGYYNGCMYLYNAAAAKSLRLYDDGALKIGDNTLLHAGNYASILDDRYVNAAGDEMTGKLTIKTANWAGQLNIYRNDTGGNSVIQYTNAEKTLGNIGVCGSAGVYPYHPCFVDGAGTTTHKLWHSGNDGAGSDLDADMLDGYHSANFVRALYAGEVDTTRDMSDMHSNMTFIGSVNGTANTPNGAGWYNVIQLAHRNGVSDGAQYVGQIALGMTVNHERMYYRTHRNRGWQTVARLSDNVASATKLANTRTIWGQNFNGEGNVTGNLTLGAGNAIIGGTSVEILKDHNNNNVTLNASNGDLFLGYWHTNKLRFYSGNSAGTGTQKMILLANGYFGVGTETPAYLCDINGETIVRGWIRTTGQRGWYNETYGGGIYMTDTTYVRVSHNKSFYCPANILAAGEITAYSDERGKECIKPLENRGGVRPVTYIKDGKQSIGFIAQDAHKLYPELVHDDGTDEHWLSFNYMQYTAVLQVQIDDIKSDVERIKEKLGI